MRISDWSSDVCSSDLPGQQCGHAAAIVLDHRIELRTQGDRHADALDHHVDDAALAVLHPDAPIDVDRRRAVGLVDPAAHHDERIALRLAARHGDGLARIVGEARDVVAAQPILEQQIGRPHVSRPILPTLFWITESKCGRRVIAMLTPSTTTSATRPWPFCTQRRQSTSTGGAPLVWLTRLRTTTSESLSVWPPVTVMVWPE